jgi:hypothetical protein
MTVRPWSRTRRFASRQKPPQCGLLDYTIHRRELRSVDSTAAAKDISFPLAGDATDASFGGGKMAVGKATFVGRLVTLGRGGGFDLSRFLPLTTRQIFAPNASCTLRRSRGDVPVNITSLVFGAAALA